VSLLCDGLRFAVSSVPGGMRTVVRGFPNPRQLVSDLWRAGFGSRPTRVRFVVNKVAQV